MAFRLLSAEPLSKRILSYYLEDSYEQSSMKFEINYEGFIRETTTEMSYVKWW